MATKTLFLAVTIAALVGAAFAACPSACSGHGACGNHDKCSCYANWAGSDCSSKACPTGKGNLACSGRGACDGGAGECACAEGYSGKACQRTLCPNECSNNGNCNTDTGLCSCFGGFSGNDCSSRKCPSGDDPLTHEVENGGTGTVMQQAEVQAVSFNSGLGVAGAATLTYTDLYGQDWTTRPFAVGGENHFVLEYALGTGFATTKVDLVLTYGGVTGGNSNIIQSTGLGDITAPKIRNALLALSTIYLPTNRANHGRSVSVTERPHATSVKLNGIIEASSRKVFDIYITPDTLTGLDENGGLLEFKAHFGTDTIGEVSDNVVNGLGYATITSAADHSADIKNALESLPNQVIPSVTVTKSLVTGANTGALGTYGNAFKQTYQITFSANANSGDQNMLACDATGCDNDGCANRKVGVADVKYIHHDDAKTGKKINFQGQGYFVMDIHMTAAVTDGYSAGHFGNGMGYLKWNTGSSVETADFALTASAATVQTALRGITGWGAVSVAIGVATDLTQAHQFTVTFPSGYDDGGQTPETGVYAASVYPITNSGKNPEISIYDQRFSNSLWIGDATGYFVLTGSSTGTVFTATPALTPEIGDRFEITGIPFGVTPGTAVIGNVAGNAVKCVSGACLTAAKSSASGFTITTVAQNAAADGKQFARIDYTHDRPTQTSQQTEDHFAVGSTIEVLDTTWVDGTEETDVTVTANVYRKFKVLSHVKNTHGKQFAKLDSQPTTDSSTDYNLKITSNNGTTASVSNIRIVAARSEVQVIKTIASYLVAKTLAQTFRIYINAGKANEEFTEVLTHGSTTAQVAEAINAFAALSGPCTVSSTHHGYDTATSDSASGLKTAWVITFAEIDGDVPELTIVTVGAATGTTSVQTISDGSSITGGADARFEFMEPGGTINVTAQEIVEFTAPSAGTAAVVAFSYDGVMQSGTGVTLGADIADGGTIDGALATITDDNGAALIGAAGDVVGIYTISATKISVTLPAGLSGAKLELHSLTGGVQTGTTKTVKRNNNGKTFRIKRVNRERTALTARATITSDRLTLVDETLNYRVGDVYDVTGCTIGTANICVNLPCTVPIISFANTAEGSIVTMAAFGGSDFTGCVANQVRDILVLDSIPDAFVGSVSIAYTGPSGACSVSEVTKGTSEGATCSNRGNCDGGSGLCACHEGYSGEACETQTVLV